MKSRIEGEGWGKRGQGREKVQGLEEVGGGEAWAVCVYYVCMYVYWEATGRERQRERERCREIVTDAEYIFIPRVFLENKIDGERNM